MEIAICTSNKTDNILIIEFYVDDIIFGSDDDSLSQQFSKDMQKEFKISFLGE